MLEFKRPFLIAIFVIIVFCLITTIIKLYKPDYKAEQISSYNILDIVLSLETLIIISLIIGYNVYKYTFPSLDIETMIEHDKYLID